MTIKDIAKESGYSVGTVSRVLNNSAQVSEKARKKVMEVVEKYHFQLNSNAKHLKKQTKDGIAIIIKGAQNMLFAARSSLVTAARRGIAQNNVPRQQRLSARRSNRTF